MIRTANRAHRAVPAQKPASSVPAEVEMRVEAILTADEDHTFTGDVEHAIGAGAGKLLGAAGVKPLIPKDRFLLAGVEFAVPVGLTRK